MYTTARDICRILDFALEIPKFKEMFCAVSYTVPATNMSEERSLVTNNYLVSKDDVRVYFDERVTGGRTGVVQDGSRCIASTAELDGMSLICVVMGSASEYRADGKTVRSFGGFPETSALLDICFEGYKTVQVIYEGQILTQFPVTNGANDVSLRVDTSVSTVLPKSITSKQLTYRYTQRSFTSPITAGQALSTVEIWYNDLCVGQAQLYAVNNVEDAGTLVKDIHSGGFNFWWLLLLIPVIVLVILVWKNWRIIRRFIGNIRRQMRRRIRRAKKRRGR